MADGRAAVSVVIPTLNEAANLAGVLPELAWADEVIVADGGSDDGTTAIARRYGATVLELTAPTIAEQRNVAIALARNDWVLALDADERVSPELQRELTEIATSPAPANTAFRIRSRNVYLGRELKHGPWGRDWKIRFFSHDQRFDARRVHENIAIHGAVGTLHGTLLHHPYRDLPHHVAKVAKYSAWSVDDLRDKHRRARLSDVLVRPAWRFARDYVLFSGWRDGLEGFIAAAVSSFSVFVKYAALRVQAEPVAAEDANCLTAPRTDGATAYNATV